jgi:hypothetical protein
MWGKLFYSHDFQDIRIAMASHIPVMVLADDNIAQYKSLGCFIMSMLLPPYESLSLEIDGNLDAAAKSYYDYLFQPQASMCLGEIITALYVGKSVMLFVPPDEATNLKFPEILINFMSYNFGIIIGDIKNPDSAVVTFTNPQAVGNMANIMFEHDYIPFERYCEFIPNNIIPTQQVIAKIMQKFYYNFNTPEECIDFCMGIILNCKQQLQSQQSGNQNQVRAVYRVQKGDAQ